MEKPVLVLNANFEPINVCGFQRAIGLMLMEKASLILNGRGTIKTPSTTFPIPSVIRLERMVQRPHPQVCLSRSEIFRRDRYTCQYCGKTTPNLTMDHVLPKHMGGKHTWINLVTACQMCNHRKGGRTLVDSGMTLMHPPKDPPLAAFYTFARYLPENNEWSSFLEGW
jgi:5-methylcytosine-specific restriction endonuclease McrA